MVSVRVLNPVVLSEFCKMSSSPAINRNLPCGRQLNRIKRDLFGTSKESNSNSSNNRYFSAELERCQELAAQKWGFDFLAGCPLSSNAAYSWERISCQEYKVAPEMYVLTRAAHVRPAAATPTSDMDRLLNERAERENFSGTLLNSSLESNTDNDSCYDSQDDSPVLHFTLPGSNSSTMSAAMPTPRKRQPKITEFMKERKRLAQTPKKISPAKRMRTNSGSSSNTSVNAGVHFSNFLKRPRHN